MNLFVIYVRFVELSMTSCISFTSLSATIFVLGLSHFEGSITQCVFKHFKAASHWKSEKVINVKYIKKFTLNFCNPLDNLENMSLSYFWSENHAEHQQKEINSHKSSKTSRWSGSKKKPIKTNIAREFQRALRKLGKFRNTIFGKVEVS